MANEKISRLLEMLDGATYMESGKERALYLLLRKNQDSLPPPDAVFHERFRQIIDVTGSAAIDMAIWHLLQDAPTFWECFRLVQEEPPA